MQQYDKIINIAAKNILAPEGLFRKGSSRVWLDDNGYFMVQVEFQPSGYSKGSFLNVGVSFLWEYSEGLNNTLAYNYGYRVDMGKKQFVPYNGNDEAFMLEMENLADVALQKVMEYRRFRDMNYAKKMLMQRIIDIQGNSPFWEIYSTAMLCFLKGDFEEGKKLFSSFMDILKNLIYDNGFYIEWRDEFYNHCMQYIQPYLESQQNAQKLILEMIKRRRDFFSSKDAFKKMNNKLKIDGVIFP